MTAVFAAFSDRTRRAPFDSLRQKGRQTLTELAEGLGMTRFGAMQHVTVLDAANLVTT